ncbi:MAG: hypothetical protein MUF87_05890 [Anaerolineae bacterium]|nr:hypothetical protein [Anaerolineae bacterium]
MKNHNINFCVILLSIILISGTVVYGQEDVLEPITVIFTQAMDGSRYAVGWSDWHVEIYETETQRLVSEVTSPDLSDKGPNPILRFSDLEFSPLGDRLAISFSGDHADSLGRIADVDTGEIIHFLNSRAFVNAVTWSPDGRYLAAGNQNSIVGLSVHYLTIWDTETGMVSQEHEFGLRNSVYSLDWHPTDPLLLFSIGSRIFVWNTEVEAQEYMVSLEGEDYFVSTLWSPNGEQFAASSSDSKIRIWEASTGNLVKSITVTSSHLGSIELLWEHHETFIVGISYNMIETWNIETEELIYSVQTQSHIIGTAWTIDNEIVYAIGGENEVEIEVVEVAK